MIRTSRIIILVTLIIMGRILDAMVNRVKQFWFLLWTATKTYLNGPYYSCIELNRKYGLLWKVRKLSPDDSDIPSSLEGKVCVITGGTRGIGLEVVKVLLKKSCYVITGSSANEQEIKKRHREILNELGDDIKGVLEIWPLDLSSMDSVRRFAAKIKLSSLKINYLICNGGVMFVPFQLTQDGFEMHFAINYLSHCLLTWLLLPNLCSAAKSSREKSRIIIVTSGLHRAIGKIRFRDLQSTKFFSVYHAYAQSKLAEIMFAFKLHDYLGEINKSNDVNVLVLHPGVCRTKLMSNFSWFNTVQSLPFFRVSK